MIATRFAVALHILTLIAKDPAEDSTSARLAWSIGTNPVVVRRISGLLARAGLITVQRGPGGASLARPAAAITLRDVWRAIHPEKDSLLRVHGRTNPACPVGLRMPGLLRTRFDQAEVAMLDNLGRTTLAELAASVSPGARDGAEGLRQDQRIA
ncbi:Rrf2 family transcriptional regulator [Siccirubricoccus sp. G192]|uniref:Rrf2 family transcriptional regulator n=1 Tax=Siccirubricoccus sp. G192 TaxID=2849651 RepID=UPI001C2C2DE4|nr:Rrf2 family transcriptional regulator [Siccirubricoccus sp. G192]MBV1795764.1 Rrf2 family transcriptional regulator [Siccirubricoccus sp. G192]